MHILVVDDDDDTRALLALGLARHGFLPAEAATLEEALVRLRGLALEAVVSDWHLGSDTAAPLIEAAGARRVVLMTGDERVLARSWPPHVSAHKKPTSLAQLARALREP